MRQRASSAAALFTAAVLGRVTTASAFVHPAQILHQHTNLRPAPRSHPDWFAASDSVFPGPPPTAPTVLSRVSSRTAARLTRGGHDGEGGEVWPRVLVVARVMTGALQAPV